NSLATLAAKANWEFVPGQRVFVENLPEALDAPGEWHLDQAAGVVSYIPLPSEDMAKVEVVAPLAREFVRVAGTAGKPVRGLRFLGLHFRHSDYELGPRGHGDWQA